jgi:2-(1,2-epoxy-1,2-dihydrophenyl)acetyl-CoA isomerase
MAAEEIILTKEEGIATIILNRPEKLNALTDEIAKLFPQKINEVGNDDSIKVVILTGAGRAFCAGADIGNVLTTRESGDSGTSQKELAESMKSHILPLVKLEKPVIGAINGAAVGAGLSLALACDIRLASENARFSAIFARIGLMPDMGATYYLPKILGTSKALELMFTGDMIDAVEAERIGLVSRVVKHDDLMAVTREFAGRLARGPSIAIQLTKKAVQELQYRELESRIEFESYGQEICLRTADYREGVKAFMEKRAPKFEGR